MACSLGWPPFPGTHTTLIQAGVVKEWDDGHGSTWPALGLLCPGPAVPTPGCGGVWGWVGGGALPHHHHPGCGPPTMGGDPEGCQAMWDPWWMSLPPSPLLSPARCLWPEEAKRGMPTQAAAAPPHPHPSPLPSPTPGGGGEEEGEVGNRGGGGSGPPPPAGSHSTGWMQHQQPRPGQARQQQQQPQPQANTHPQG